MRLVSVWLIAFLFPLIANAQVSTQNEVIVFGPKTYKAALLKPAKFADTFNKVTSEEPLKLLIRNGSEKAHAPQNCSGLSLLNRLKCELANIATLATRLLDRVAAGEVKVNGKKVATINLDTHHLVISLSQLSASNKIELSLQGSPTASLRVEIKAPASTVNTAPLASFTMTPSSGAIAPETIALNAMGSSDPDPGDSIVSYAWDFGDGSMGSGLIVSHLYSNPGTYQIKLRVTDTKGAFSESTKQLVVATNALPLARASATPLSGSAPLTVNFDGRSSIDSDGQIALYEWTFGDGGSATGAQVSHVYSAAGIFQATLRVVDNKGANHSTSLQIQVDPPNVAPSAVIRVTGNNGIAPMMVVLDGTQSSDPDGTIAKYEWSLGGGAVLEGPYISREFPVGRTRVSLKVTDNRGASNQASVEIVANDIQLPPEPSTIAPVVAAETLAPLSDLTKFIYTGPNAIQVGVAADTIDERFTSLVRGKVLDEDGQPVSGVQIRALDKPQYGSTLTRENGEFDFVVNGGGEFTINFERSGYFTAQRRVTAIHQGSQSVDDVFMLRPDPVVTRVQMNSAETQVARGSLVTDQDGTRTATIILPKGITANIRLANGGTMPVPNLSIRAKEYTVGENGPQRMPAYLPSTSAYTYAVELSADETLALKGKGVEFSKPFAFYVENFLGFDVGDRMPVGIYNEEKGAWVATKNGRVIRILSVANGIASVDVNGAGAPATEAEMTGLGIDADELQKLASLYTVNTTLWRVPLSTFSAVDINVFQTDIADTNPPDSNPSTPGSAPESVCKAGSVIGVVGQTLGESIGILGTPFSLNYTSARVPGRVTHRALDIQVVPSDLSSLPNFVGTDLKVEVAGQTFRRSFNSTPNQVYRFVWDGKDVYGREIPSAQIAKVSVSYKIGANYLRATSNAPDNTFAYLGPGLTVTAIPSRQETMFTRTYERLLGVDSTLGSQGVGGWTFDVHHSYNPISKTVFFGDGGSLAAEDIGAVVTTAVGTGVAGFSGDGGPASLAQVNQPGEVTVGPDNSLYIRDSGNARIRKVDVHGNIQTIVGNGSTVFNGDGLLGPQTSISGFGGMAVHPITGELYFVDRSLNRVRKLGRDGRVQTVAGTGEAGFSGDGGPAEQATLRFPADLVFNGGSLYFTDKLNNRVRVIQPDGVIRTFAGNAGITPFVVRGNVYVAINAVVRVPESISLGLNGDLYIVEENRVRRINRGGMLSPVVGNGLFSEDNGILGYDVYLKSPTQALMSPDGSMYIADLGHPAIRKVNPDGIVSDFYGTRSAGVPFSEGEIATRNRFSPLKIALGNDSSLYLTESGQHRVKKITRPSYAGVATTDVTIPSSDGSEIYVFNEKGRHLRTLYALTGATKYSFEYDSSYKLTAIVDAFGNTTTIDRNGQGEPQRILAPNGQVTRVGVGSTGDLVSLANPNDETYSMSYKEGGLLTSFKKPRGNTSVFTYDVAGALIKDEDAKGGFTSLESVLLANGYQVNTLSAEGRAESVQTTNDSLGQMVTRQIASDGSLTTTTNIGAGETRIVTADQTISVTSKSDPRFGASSSYRSSVTTTLPSNLASSETVSRTATISPTNPFDFISRETVNRNGRAVTSTYTSNTRTLRTVTASGLVSEVVVNDYEQPVSIKPAGLAPISQSYDERGRLASRTTMDRATTFEYDGLGRLMRQTNAVGQATEFGYDKSDRLISTVIPDGRVISFSYDANGNRTGVTPPGRSVHGNQFDLADLASHYVAPVVDGQPSTTTYSYNLDRQLTRVLRPDGQTLTYQYSPSSSQLLKIVAPGGEVEFSYVPNSSKIQSVRSVDNVTTSYTYDGSLLKSISQSGAASGSIGFSYNNDFLPSNLQIGSAQIGLQYNADLKVSKASSQNLNYSASTGLLEQKVAGVVTTTFTRNALGEVVSETTKVGNQDIFSRSYTRDRLGRVTSVQENSVSTASNYQYDYDVAGRLKKVSKNNSPYSEYTYDSNSNRVSVNREGVVIHSTYDGQDRLVTSGSDSFMYSNNGELLRKTKGVESTAYEHDVFGQLKRVALPDGKIIQYVTDGQNRRVAKLVNGVREKAWVYQSQYQIAGELGADGALQSVFVYSSKSNVPDLILRPNQTLAVIKDQIGSVRLVIDTGSGVVVQELEYDEFGRILRDTNPGIQPFGFAGGLYDAETSLVRFGAREYDPETGRWLSKDPILFEGGDTNLFGYVLQDPVNMVDPDGKRGRFWPWVWRRVLEFTGVCKHQPELCLGIVDPPEPWDPTCDPIAIGVTPEQCKEFKCSGPGADIYPECKEPKQPDPPTCNSNVQCCDKGGKG